MKKYWILLLFFIPPNLFPADELPSIILPKVDIQIEDKKQFDIKNTLEASPTADLQISAIPRPDFTEEIKIDLEKTLPQRIESPEKQKPVDALILMGYGLNNQLYGDFSIFVKQLNPKISVHYLRQSKETLWFDRDIKNSYSLDDLKSELIYGYKNFNLGTEIGYFAESYQLQQQSIYNDLTKRILYVDLGPSLKFNNQNDLTIRLFNSFLFTNANEAPEKNLAKRNDFDYLLNTDIIYSQIFGNNHYFTVHTGYDFNFVEANVTGRDSLLADHYQRAFFNSIKAGIGYSTIIIDSFLIKADVNFLGMFKDYDFFWYILPVANLGYSFQDFFHCYIEGGAKLAEKPGRSWFKEQKYAVYPLEITPGYHFYAKTGIKGAVSGWFSFNTDFEFAYNKDSFNWKLTNKTENLYTFTKINFMELNLGAGLTFSVKDYFQVKADWLHYFYERQVFTARDNLTASIKWEVPRIGLSFYVDFTGQFSRLNPNGQEMGNVYLMNAGIDWNWQERLGIGAKFDNILYFQTYQLKSSYDEPGFEFLGYIRIGF